MCSEINSNLKKKNEDNHHHLTRSRSNFITQPFKLTQHRKSPIHAGCFLFNFLPREMRYIKKESSFKFTLKKLLIKGSYYNIKEFVDDMKRL